MNGWKTLHFEDECDSIIHIRQFTDTSVQVMPPIAIEQSRALSAKRNSFRYRYTYIDIQVGFIVNVNNVDDVDGIEQSEYMHT